MNCIKDKKFLFWKWKTMEHTYKPHRVEKFMSCSDDFHVIYECKNCGVQKTRIFVEQDELLLMGVHPDKIWEIGTWGKNIEELTNNEE